jgi:murein DD-endopeptidase MepM/ murein hydrolase activator NlpD
VRSNFMSYKSSSKLNPFIKQILILMGGVTLLSSSLVIAQETTESVAESAPTPVAPAPKTESSPPPQLSAPRVSVPSQPPVNAADLLPPPQPIAPQAKPKITPQNSSFSIPPAVENNQAPPSVVFETRDQGNTPTGNNQKPSIVNPNPPSSNQKPPSLKNSPSNNNSPNSAQNPTYTRKNPIIQSRNNNYNNSRNNYKPTVINQNNHKIVAEPTVYNRATKVIKKYIPTNTSLLYPLSIPAPITSAFGWRIHPISGTGRLHGGTDIGAPYGTPVLAAYQGKVEVAGNLGGYGLTVTIRHEDSTQESLYAHLSQVLVQSGQWVEQGTVVGLVGSTGYSTGPHLHFEWRHLTPSGWVAVDAGDHLKLAMEALINSMEVASVPNSTNNN